MHDWREFSEFCITGLITFNKRKSGEPTTLLIKRFNKRKDYSKGCSDQILDTLLPIEENAITEVKICSLSIIIIYQFLTYSKFPGISHIFFG